MTKRNIFQQKSVRHDSLVFLQLTFCFPFIKMCLFAPFLCFLKKKWISMRNISKRWRGSGRLVFLMSCVKVILLEDMKMVLILVISFFIDFWSYLPTLRTVLSSWISKINEIILFCAKKRFFVVISFWKN